MQDDGVRQDAYRLQVIDGLLEDVARLVVIREEDALVVAHVLDANSGGAMGGGAVELYVKGTKSVEVEEI